MKASLLTIGAIGLILPVGIALAQKEPGNQSSKNGSNTATTPGAPAQTASSTKTDKSTEVKTKTYKGTLVDAACASGATNSAAASSSSSSADRAAANSSSAKSSTAAGKGCDATASTTDFGLRVNDGQVLRFDSVGDERAKEAMTSNKKWSKDASNGKSIHASVNGSESGNELTVLSIH